MASGSRETVAIIPSSATLAGKGYGGKRDETQSEDGDGNLSSDASDYSQTDSFATPFREDADKERDERSNHVGQEPINSGASSSHSRTGNINSRGNEKVRGKGNGKNGRSEVQGGSGVEDSLPLAKVRMGNRYSGLDIERECGTFFLVFYSIYLYHF